MAGEHTIGTRARSMFMVLVVCGVILLTMAVPTGTNHKIEGFDAFDPGTVVAGETPGGGSVPGTIFPGFRLTVENHGGGPNSLILFGSHAPTGQDVDLGAPNASFGGPGIGAGGAAGQPGENALPLGNLLIIAQDIVDFSPPDGLVDDPGDEAAGGLIRFDFADPTIVETIHLVDIDEQNRAGITLHLGDQIIGTTAAEPRGDNSVQSIQLDHFGAVTRMEVELVGSGAIGWMSYLPPVSAGEKTSWGELKDLFR